jgi:histone acetyltransferase (RNA polymerase elongator complex component)
MKTAALSSPPRQGVKFFAGIRKKKKCPVIPVFFPFMGCPHRCVFCAQDVQTGQIGQIGQIGQTGQTGRIAVPVEQALDRVRGALRAVPEDGSDCSLAFYGGTFTLWPRALQLECLRLARQAGGARLALRCSTRPDALDPAWLEQLRAHDLALIEVGVQSFDDAALRLAERGYTGAVAEEGCRRVREAGLACGVQLMPGMPGVEPDVFLRVVAVALAGGAACLRFYPCLVLEGTRLAEWWQDGRYAPWDLDVTVRTLGRALAMAWAAEVPVIRMGLAPGRELEAAVLAGPRHPALGGLIQAEALARTVESLARDSLAAGVRPVALRLPVACRGFMGGKSAPLWERFAAVGLSRAAVFWQDGEYGSLEF